MAAPAPPRAGFRVTCERVKISEPSDAELLIHAVALGRLPIITRRLDPDERRLIRPGDVFVWEERAATADAVGIPLERWTDSRHWGPSRIRDDFLFYHERESAADDLGLAREPGEAKLINVDPRRFSGAPRDGPRAPALPLNAPRALDENRLIKQTYSAYVLAHDPPRKWHITTYFTQASLPALQPVRAMPQVAQLTVPPGLYVNSKNYPPRRAGAAKRASPPRRGSVAAPYPTPAPAPAGLPSLARSVPPLTIPSMPPMAMSPRHATSPLALASPYGPSSPAHGPRGLPSPADVPGRVVHRRSPEDHRALQSFHGLTMSRREPAAGWVGQ